MASPYSRHSDLLPTEGAIIPDVSSTSDCAGLIVYCYPRTYGLKETSAQVLLGPAPRPDEPCIFTIPT